MLAEQSGDTLSIQFVQRVFLRSTKAYKSVLYKCQTPESGFWRGRATDRQINDRRETARYWIDDFLASTLVTLGPAGSRRLAAAMRGAIENSPIEIKEELVAAVRLIPNQSGKLISASKLLERLGVSEQGVSLVRQAMSRADLMDESFEIDSEEFVRYTAIRSIELDNGALLMAATNNFETVFTQRQVAEGRVMFETEGRIINQRIKRQV